MGAESPVRFSSVLGAPGAPGPQAAPSPWKDWSDHISYLQGVVVGQPNGNNMGPGTLNAEMLYIEGQNALAEFVEIKGDTMTGPLHLYADPLAALEAVPKQYVDKGLADVLAQAEASGSEFWGVYDASRGTIRWNSDANQSGNALPAPTFALEGKFLICEVGGTAPPSGAPPVGTPPSAYKPGDWLVCNGSAWLHLEVAVGTVSTGDVPPATPTPGAMWFDAVSLQLYVYYDDGNSRQWIVAINQAPHMEQNYLPLTGGTLSGPLLGTTAKFDFVTNIETVLDCTPAAFDTALVGQNNSYPRWRISLVTPQSETGSEVGSNLTIDSFADAGGYLDTPFSINRANGNIQMRAASVASQPADDNDVVRKLDLDTAIAGVVPPTVDLTAYLPLAGGTMTGVLKVIEPTGDQEAATKHYTDQRVDQRLPLSGGTMTGFITLHADPTADKHPATKGYVDNNTVGKWKEIASKAPTVSTYMIFNNLPREYSALMIVANGIRMGNPGPQMAIYLDVSVNNGSTFSASKGAIRFAGTPTNMNAQHEPFNSAIAVWEGYSNPFGMVMAMVTPQQVISLEADEEEEVTARGLPASPGSIYAMETPGRSWSPSYILPALGGVTIHTTGCNAFRLRATHSFQAVGLIKVYAR